MHEREDTFLAGHADWAPLSLLAGLLSQQPNGRLYHALVESKKTTSVNAFAGNNHDPGLFSAMAQAEPAQLETVKDTLIHTMESLPEVPFTQAEIDKAKLRSRRSPDTCRSSEGRRRRVGPAARHRSLLLLDR